MKTTRSAIAALPLLGTLLLWATVGEAATCTATTAAPQPRNWGTAATWSCGPVPAKDDNVVIPNGATVVLNVNTNRVADLQINAGGVLRGDNTNKSLTMNNGAGVDITNNGTFDFGQGNLATVFLRQSLQWQGTGTWNLSTIDINTNTLSFVAGSTFTINMSGAASPFLNAGTVTSLSTITWNFTGTVAQTLPTSTNVRYGAVTVSNTTGTTLGVALTSTNILDNLTVAANGVLNNGGFAVTLAAGKSFAMQAGSQFNLTGTSTMVSVSGGGTKTFNATSTVTYGGANQAVTAETYGNLTLSGSGTKTPAAGTTTIQGNFTLAAGVTYAGTTNNPVVNLAGNFSNSGTFDSGTGTFTFNGTAAGQTISGNATAFTSLTVANTNAAGVTANTALTIGTFTINASSTFNAGSSSHSVTGDFTNNGIFNANTSTFTFNGAANQNIAGTSATTFNNLAISNASGVTLSGATNTTVSTLLTLTSGVITTGTNTLITSADCNAPAVSRTSGHVAGNLRKRFPVGNPSCAFEIGDANNYTPITAVALGSVTVAGDLTARTDTPDHPDTTADTSGIDKVKSVNRYWTLTSVVGLTFTGTYSATFNFCSPPLAAGCTVSDQDAGASFSSFIVARKISSAWSLPSVATKMATSTQTTGITQAQGFGDFAIGEPKDANFSREKEFIYTRELY